MNMNYEPMWRVVDAHRRCADELERTLRELTGDQPDDESKRDDIYNSEQFITILKDARDELWRIADREGHSVRRQDASRCQVFATRCDHAIDEVRKWANR